MRNRVFVGISVMLLLAFNKMDAQNVWVQKADFPGSGRNHAVAFSIGTTGYVGTGEAVYGGANENDFWAWNQLTDTWTQVAALPASVRWAAAGFAIKGIGYVGFGINGSTLYGDLWAYNPTTNAWTAKTGLTAHPRFAPFCFVSGDTAAYLGGGNINSGFLKDTWEYNPTTDHWTQKADVPNTGFAYPAAFFVNNAGYVGGGYGGGNYLSAFWQYNPATDVWAAKANIPGFARSGPIGFALNGVGYMGLGVQVSNASLSDFYKYNDTTDTWAAVTSAFPDSARQAAPTFVIGNAAYMCTGSTNFDLTQTPISRNTRDLWQFGLVTAGIKNVTPYQPITTYPNPTNNILNIILPENATVTICNMLNQPLYKAMQQKGNVRIDVSKFSNGTYLLYTTSAGNAFAGRFVVQR